MQTPKAQKILPVVSVMPHLCGLFQFPKGDKEKNTYHISYPFLVHLRWCTLIYVQYIVAGGQGIKVKLETMYAIQCESVVFSSKKSSNFDPLDIEHQNK